MPDNEVAGESYTNKYMRKNIMAENILFKKYTDAEEFIKRSYADIDGIPNGYIYNPETKEFIEK